MALRVMTTGTSGQPPPGRRAARDAPRPSRPRYGIATRCDRSPAPAVSTRTPAIRLRRSNGDSRIVTACTRANGATVVWRQSQPLRNAISSSVTAQPSAAADQRALTTDHGTSTSSAPNPRQPSRPDQRHAHEQRDEQRLFEQAAHGAGMHRLPLEPLQRQHRQHLRQQRRQRATFDDGGQPVPIGRRVLAGLAASRVDARRDPADQPVQRAFAQRQRLDAAQRDRRRHACQQPVLGAEVFAFAGQAEAVQANGGPQHRQQANQDEQGEDGESPPPGRWRRGARRACRWLAPASGRSRGHGAAVAPFRR